MEKRMIHIEEEKLHLELLSWALQDHLSSLLKPSNLQDLETRIKAASSPSPEKELREQVEALRKLVEAEEKHIAIIKKYYYSTKRKNTDEYIMGEVAISKALTRAREIGAI